MTLLRPVPCAMSLCSITALPVSRSPHCTRRRKSQRGVPSGTRLGPPGPVCFVRAGSKFAPALLGRARCGPILRRIRYPAATTAVLVVGGDELLRVTIDAVLRDVQAVELLLRLDPESDGRLEYGEDHIGGHEDEASAGSDSQSLYAELSEAAAVEEAGLADRGGLCQGGGGEEAGRERAPDAAHAVGRDGAQGIVRPNPIHEEQDGVHDHTGHEAYDDGGPGVHEGAGGGDGDERRYRAVAHHPDVEVAPV